MRVAVDIDGVLSKTFEQFFKEMLRRGVSRDELVFSSSQQVTAPFPDEVDGDIRSMYEREFSSLRVSYEPVEGSRVITNVLGEELIAVTNRKLFGQESVCLHTQEWLAKNSFPISEVIHTQDKASVLSEQGFDVLIEDFGKNALAVANQGIAVLLLDTYYNRYVSHPLITRFSHWLEVPLLLKRLNSR
ncbi:MAG: 5' nucleotidase, NT5C type [Candidatus Woesearchaeota archaeon]